MSQPGASGALRTLFVLTCFSLAASEMQKLDIVLDKGTSLNISSSPSTGSRCQVCTGSGRTRQCAASRLLKNTSPVSVELECTELQGPFNVEINRTIDCFTKSCNGDIRTTSNYDTLLTLNRKFIWNLNAASLNAAKINFTRTGVKQIKPSEHCPDKHSYTFEVLQDSGDVTVGRFCKHGSIKNVQARGSSRFSLELPAGQRLQNIKFTVSVGEKIKSLSKISLTLPQGMSNLELYSPNYLGSFPDNDLVEWYFTVPTKHKSFIQLSDVIQPRCLKNEPAVEYRDLGRKSLVVGLREKQPIQNQGSFSMTLKNCEVDKRRAGSTGLSLNFKVSTFPVLCTVDLKTQMPEFSLHIKKLRPSSECVVKLNLVPKDQFTLTPFSVSELSFETCLPEEIEVTATKHLGCDQVKDCPEFSLSVPSLPPCLPALLSNVTWTLSPPQDGTVELVSPSVPLRQELPGQTCDDNITIKMTEDDGTTIGNFCSNGTIDKVQIHINMSISVCGTAGNALFPSSMPLLVGRINEEISETYIFTVSPKKNIPLFLATPGWPKGMKSYSTVSWIVTVPPKMEAHLMFANLSQPKCSNSHTNIMIKRIGSLEEEYSRQEDEKAEKEITVSASFYLNMSNCMPERGDFSVVFKITLQKSRLLITVVSIVAALVFIFIVALVVVCLVIRKKKKNRNPQVSVYNPNGTSFLPGHNGFPSSRADNESHVYESIDETLIYSHLLLRREEQSICGESDKYSPTAGHKNVHTPLVAPDGTAGKMEVGMYQEFPVSHQPNPPLPKRPPSHMQQLVNNDIFESEEHSEDEQSTTLGPRLDPEGGEHTP